MTEAFQRRLGNGVGRQTVHESLEILITASCIDAMVLDLTIIAWCCINGGPNHLLALAMKAARLRGL